MDENVLAAALRLNEPITFGRVEPLHDAGRHRSPSPFWNFDDTGTPHRIQDVARHARIRRFRFDSYGDRISPADEDAERYGDREPVPPKTVTTRSLAAAMARA
jgi:hypothetical protein